MGEKKRVSQVNGIGTKIENARAELNSLAAQHGYNLQHEEVQAASKKLDLLILQSYRVKQKGGRQ